MTDYWPPIITGAAALLGALVGGGISFWSQRAIKDREVRIKRASLAYAIAAEIETYVELVRRRGHQKRAESAIATNRAGNKLVPKNFLSQYEKDNNPFPVVYALLPDIGLLGPASAEAARFYLHVQAVRITAMISDDGAFDHLTPNQVADMLQAELDLWNETLIRGERVVQTLRDIAAKQ